MYEHVVVSDAASKQFEISPSFNSAKTPGVIAKLRQLAESGPPDVAGLGCDVPDWMTNHELWATACADEEHRYNSVSEDVLILSDSREVGKSESLLGGNLTVPELDRGHGDEVISTKSQIEEYETSELADWDGIRDALEPSRNLVTGNEAIIGADIYKHYRNVDARVMSYVTPLCANSRWAFLSVRATAHGAPRWMLIELGGSDECEVDIGKISCRLRELLAGDPPSRVLDEQATPLCQKWCCQPPRGNPSSFEKDALAASSADGSKIGPTHVFGPPGATLNTTRPWCCSPDTLCPVTVVLKLPEEVIARLQAEAERRGLAVDDLIVAFAETLPTPPDDNNQRHLGFVASGASVSGISDKIDELLVDGFGRS